MGTRSFSRAALAGLVVATIVACGNGIVGEGTNPPGDGNNNGSGGPPGGSPTTSPTPPGPPDNGPVVDECVVDTSVCTGKDRRHACLASPKGTRWVDETCASGSGCFKGGCVVGKCSDECTLGETQTTGGGAAKTCKPWSIATNKTADAEPATKLHDRARGYLGWMKRGPMASGAIGSAHFTDLTYTTIDAMHGIGDSAIWTGAFLASESFRLQATGAPDARTRVRALVDTLHLWLNVAGEPGMLVRWAKESSTTLGFPIPDYNCSVERVHCNVDHAGKKYDFIGHISRDQYQGVMFGLAAAYDALTPGVDEDARALIRTDVVTIVKELMKERTLPVRLTFNGVKMSPQSVTARFIVVSPREMVDGAIDLRVNLSKPDDSEMYGFQEFYPNLSHLIRQLPGLSWVPDIKRASSAIMLAAFFRAALRVTEGVPALAKDRADILAYYTGHTGEGGNISDWLAVAKTWSDGDNCGGGYYANNITMMPMYTLARLEDDPARSLVVKNELLGAKLWPAFEKTKNTFFSFIYSGVTPAAAPAITPSALGQLTTFPVAPRVHHAVDLRSDPKYPTRDPDCADHVNHDQDAVDVGDRETGDFLWQRHPWGLVAGGDEHQTEPGVDYLTAYFMGRHHGFIEDDTPTTCLAWQ